MKQIFRKTVIFLFVAFSLNTNAQSFNTDKTAFSNFIKRMYTSSPFEGVKIVDDYDHQYLISVISLEKAKYTSESTMNRVAQVKAQSQANTFINGSNITMDMVIRTTETKDSTNTKTIVESVEIIKENASGFTQGMELLSNFDNQDNLRKVFVYCREMKKED
jgi:hypothetical protein